MKKIAFAVMAVIAITSSIGSAVWPFPNFGTTGSGTPESITIGTSPVEGSSLIYIADDRGYFAMNGLNVTIRGYDTGRANVDMMKKGDADISVSSEYPLVTEAFKKESISVIGTIDKFQTQYIVGRKDRGIENTSDLKGKRVGVSRGTIREFYLGRFLNLHGISLKDVDIVNVPTLESADAIANGSVDAIIYYPPYIDTLKDQIGDKVVIWPAQSSQLTYEVIACRNDWAASHTETIGRLLGSLALAEQYTINHPEEAKAIVHKRLNFTDKYMAAVWPDHHYSLTLDQSLISAMEDEARWMIENNLTAEKQVPNFLDYIYEDGLKAIKPESVNIIR
jgi:NitT/TauT family transport system substrate-binding protein